jgi:hypothetical protein
MAISPIDFDSSGHIGEQLPSAATGWQVRGTADSSGCPVIARSAAARQSPWGLLRFARNDSENRGDEIFTRFP